MTLIPSTYTNETEIPLTQDVAGTNGNTTITNPPNMYVQGSLLGPPAGTTKAFTGGGSILVATNNLDAINLTNSKYSSPYTSSINFVDTYFNFTQSAYDSTKNGTIDFDDNYFSFTVTKAANLAVKGTFTPADFTQTTGSSSTLSDTAIDSVIEYSDLSITIDNTVSPNTARIEGYLKITHGYDSGGHTLVALDVNDILQNA